MKKLIQQILVVVFLTMILMSSSAQAGLLDWFTTNKAQAQEAQNGSFDQLYASVTSSMVADTDQPIISATTNAIEGFATPSGIVSKVSRAMRFVQVSGYNSEVGQTDDSPFITANGTHVRDGIVAANIISASGYNVPFNTIIKFKNCGGIPEDKIFTVTDRLNKRYTNNVDIWFESHTDAVKFGRRNCQIEVIK